MRGASAGSGASWRRAVQTSLRRRGYEVVRANGRHVETFPDDTFLVSYPRSGNTWVSFLLTNVMFPTPTTFHNLESRCPDIYVNSPSRLRDVSRPRLVKSHEMFNASYPRVIYLVRDPRDVVVSYFRFLTKMRALPPGMVLDQFVPRFVRGHWDAQFGNWGAHAAGWVGAGLSETEFLLLRYEDFHADPLKQLKFALDFLEVEADDATCAAAVELSSSSRMRSLEETEAPANAELKDSRLDLPFVGSATVGEGRAQLRADLEELIVDRWTDLMARLGYPAA